MSILIVDVESDGLLPELTRLWCMVVADLDGNLQLYSDHDSSAPGMAEGIRRISKADVVIMHNGLGFDYWAINRCYPGTLEFAQVLDTLLLSRMLCSENTKHSLEAWGQFLGFPKGQHSDWSQYTPEMGSYCVQDVRVTIKVYQELMLAKQRDESLGVDWEPAIRVEHRVGFVLALQEQHGFRLDLRAAGELTAELRQELTETHDELRQLWAPIWVPEKATWCFKGRSWTGVGYKDTSRNRSQVVGDHRHSWEAGTCWTPVRLQEFNPSSRQQIAQRLSRTHGWKPTKYTPAGSPQIDDAVLASLPFPEAALMARSFRLTKQLGQISDGDNAWLKLERNGYVHGAINQVGARTHRMSHFSPNMAQVDKKDKRMRAVWLPDEGQALVGCDAEGLELRMLAHFLYRWDRGVYAEAVVNGSKEDETDVHNVNKRAVGLYLRDSAKTFIYALIYGAGDNKLGATILEDARQADHPISGSKTNLGKRARLRMLSRVTGLDRLVSACKTVHDKRGWFKGLDGRKIPSASAHSALNTVLQSGGALVMKYALAIWHFEKAIELGLVDQRTLMPSGFDYCANVHDEVQLSVSPELAEQVGKGFADCIRLAGEHLHIKCPLSGSYDIGKSWADTH